MARICWISLILTGMLIGTAVAGYSFGSADSMNGSILNHTQISGSPIDSESVKVAMMKLPISFIENRGQVSDEAKFLVKASTATIYFADSNIVFALLSKNNSSVIRMSLEGAKPVRPVGGEMISGKANFFIGNNSSQWITDIPTYASVRYHEIYPGVDLVFKGIEGNLKHELVLSPGADPAIIVFIYSGQDNLSLKDDGSLLIRTQAGNITDSAPVFYQDINGKRAYIEGKFRKIDGSRIGFEVMDYNRSLPLVIDPALVYSTYLGGGGDSNIYNMGNDIAVDGSGNAYVIGSTWSPAFPIQNAYQTFLNGTSDAFITKLNSTGKGLIYSTYLGGSSDEQGNGIAVDGSGNAYITGFTSSSNFPTRNAYNATLRGSEDAFITKLNSTGEELGYSTYLGGSRSDKGNGIAIDGNGNAYVTGYTYSSNFPTKNAFSATLKGGEDAFITKLNSTGKGLIYSTYLGGSFGEICNDIAVDGSGNAYVTGYTESNNFPTKNAYQPTLKGSEDAFITKLNSTGKGLVYSTYLGGNDTDSIFQSSYERGYGIAVDARGNAYVAGYTDSNSFPTKNAYQPSLKGISDAFITKLNSTGNELIYSTYLGGGLNEMSRSIAVDSSGNAYITGSTGSTDFPTKNAIQANLSGEYYASDAFITKLNSTGKGLVYSTYLGGAAPDKGFGIAIDASRNAYVAGETNSLDFPIQNAYQQSHSDGIYDAFVAKIPSAPEIITQPSNATCCAGRDVSFTVVANGTQPLIYQWKRNNVTIAGTNISTLSINSVTPANAGVYTVDVNNSYGSVTSSWSTLTVNTPLQIVCQPESIACCAGSSAAFNVTAAGTGPFSYQWTRNGVNLTDQAGHISGATTNTLTINNVTPDDAGNYRAIITGTCGSAISDQAALSLKAATGTTDPTPQSVCLGGSATFGITAVGSGLSYQWKKNGADLPDEAGHISGTKTDSLTITSVAQDDVGSYSIVVTGECGSATSNPVALTLKAATGTTDPSPQAVCLGGSATFNITASGTGPFSYQWKKNGADMYDEAGHISGNRTNSITISPVAAEDAASYFVVVTGECGSATSNPVALTFKDATGITDPSPQAVCLGGSATFSVTASGTEPFSYQWKKNGVNLADEPGHIGGVTTNELTINSIIAGDAGNYSVDVIGGCGKVTSGNATLTVNLPPQITGQPAGLACCNGGQASFSVTATGSGLSYQWQKNGDDLQDEARHISGNRTSSLTINPVAAGDAGNYIVIVTDACGSATSKQAALTIKAGPTITSQPVNASVCLGSPASFSVTASGASGYQWQKIAGSSWNSLAGKTSPTLSWTGVTASDAGKYRILVTSIACGSIASCNATLAVSSPLKITAPPADVTCCTGRTASFSVAASGSTTLSYQWKKGNTIIKGAIAATYTIPSVSSSDAGTYKAVITSPCGSVTSRDAVLKVLSPPVIPVQPSIRTVAEGASITFAIGARGTGLTYQWKKDGTNIPGATSSSYNIAHAALADAGTYSIAVGNGYCSAESSLITLVVKKK